MLRILLFVNSETTSKNIFCEYMKPKQMIMNILIELFLNMSYCKGVLDETINFSVKHDKLYESQ